MKPTYCWLPLMEEQCPDFELEEPRHAFSFLGLNMFSLVFFP